MVQIQRAYAGVVSVWKEAYLMNSRDAAGAFAWSAAIQSITCCSVIFFEASIPRGTSGTMSATASRQALMAASMRSPAAAQLPPKQLWRSMRMRATSLEFAGSRKLTRVSAYSCATLTSTSE